MCHQQRSLGTYGAVSCPWASHDLNKRWLNSNVDKAAVARGINPVRVGAAMKLLIIQEPMQSLCG
jgi:hypothetical protein